MSMRVMRTDGVVKIHAMYEGDQNAINAVAKKIFRWRILHKKKRVCLFERLEPVTCLFNGGG